VLGFNEVDIQSRFLENYTADVSYQGLESSGFSFGGSSSNSFSLSSEMYDDIITSSSAMLVRREPGSRPILKQKLCVNTMNKSTEVL